MSLNADDTSIAGFTMIGHTLVTWFETSIPIFPVARLAEFDVPVARLGLVVALGYGPFGLGALLWLRYTGGSVDVGEYKSDEE